MENNIKKKTFGYHLGQFIIRWRWAVLLTTILLALITASGLQHAGFNNDYRVFFSKENPQLKAFDALQKKYTKDDNVYVVIEPKNGKVFEREVLLAINELVDSSWQTPYSSRVDAITNYQFTKAEGDNMFVEDLISNVEEKSDAEIKKAEQNALADPILINRLINEDASLAGVNIVIKKPDTEAYQKLQAEKRGVSDSLGITVTTYPDAETEVAAFVRNQVAQLKEKHPSIKTHLSGVVMLSNAFGEAANEDLSTLIPAMYGIIILTLILLVLFNTGIIKGISGSFKSILTAVNTTLATLLVLLFSILGGVGVMSYLGVALTSVSVSAPTMILTLAVADSIHILITLLQGMRNGLSKNEAIIESLRVNFMPVFITSLTTVVGFLTMNFSDSPPFRDLGNIAATGVGLAFIYSVTLLPALLSILPIWVKKKQKVNAKTKTNWLDRLAGFVIGNRRSLMAGSVAVIGLLLFFASRNNLNEQFVEYFDDRIEFRRATDYMADNITGIYTVEYSVSAGEEGGISNPDFLQTLAEFEEWFKQNDKVVHISTYNDIARKVNKSMHGDNPAEYKLPDNREEAAQYLLLYEMSLPFGLDLNNQINVDKSETRFIVTVDNITAKELIALSEAGESWLNDHQIKGESNLGIGTAIMFAHLTQRQIYSMAKGGLWAILLISIVLMLALRNVKFGLLSIIPNIIPVAAAFGFWYFLSGQITSGLAIVFSMTIGIVVDDTVHLFAKYLRARREQNKTSEEAIHYAFNTVGMAIITTTIVLSAGFFILGQSAFAMNAGMAQLTAITIIIALIIDMLFLPALMLAVDKNKIPATQLNFSNNLKFSKMKNFIMILFVMMIAISATAQNKGLDIAKKYDEAYTGWGSYTSTTKMILKNQHGQESTRLMDGRNFEEETDGDKSMIIFNSPKDVKGTAVLTYTHKEGSDDQWLFLPSIKRVKRIASNNKSGPFVGSEFAYEDLSSQEIEKYTYKYLKEETMNGATCHVIERNPVDSKSGYKFMYVYHNPDKRYRIEKIVFFDRKGSKFKTLLYKDYQQYKGKYWFPGELHMTNHQSKKETRILFEDYNFDVELDEKDFSQTKLKSAA